MKMIFIGNKYKSSMNGDFLSDIESYIKFAFSTNPSTLKYNHVNRVGRVRNAF